MASSLTVSLISGVHWVELPQEFTCTRRGAISDVLDCISIPCTKRGNRAAVCFLKGQRTQVHYITGVRFLEQTTMLLTFHLTSNLSTLWDNDDVSAYPARLCGGWRHEGTTPRLALECSLIHVCWSSTSTETKHRYSNSHSTTQQDW